MELSSVDEEKGTHQTFGFRHVVIFLTFIGAFCSYATKVSFSVALIAMVNSSHLPTIEEKEFNDSYCTDPQAAVLPNKTAQSTNAVIYSFNSTDSRFRERFDWDYKTQSSLLAALFYGCTVSQVFGGILTLRFGIRWVFGITMLISSLLSLITPLAASWDALAVIAIRVIQGVLQGPLSPVRSQSVSYWVPIMERSKAFAFITMGNQFGIIAGMFISGILADSEILSGWPSVFYMFGIFGTLVSVIWMSVVTDSPQQHHCVSKREIELIQENQQNKRSERPTVPWRRVFKSLPVWSYILACIGYDILFAVLTAELPMYLNKVLRYSIASSGSLSAVPFLLQVVGIFVGGHVSDAVRRSQKLSITNVRKIMTVLGYIGCSLCYIAIGFAGCRKVLIVVLLCISNLMAGISASGFLIAVVDMSPTFSAALTGIGATIGILSSVPVPYVVAFLTRSGNSPENWSMVFFVLAIVLLITGLQFVVFGSAERQLWDYPESSTGDGSANTAKKIEEP